jgi:tetratricopeptide (TPR) repeat protein
VLRALGRVDDAIQLLEAYRAQAGDTLATLLTLADLYGVAGDLATAGARIDAAAQLAPDLPAVAAARIQWLAAQGDFDGVLELLKARRTSHPDDYDTLVAGANALASSPRETDRRAARALVEEVVTLEPGHVPAHSTLGKLAYHDGDLARAEQAYRTILEYVPQDAAASNDLAWVLAEGVEDGAETPTVADLARLEEALALARVATAADPTSIHFLDTRGVVLAKYTDRRHLEEARDDLERCYRAAPEDTERRARAALTLSRVLVRLGEGAAAAEFLEESERIDAAQRVFSPEERAQLEKLLRAADRR